MQERLVRHTTALFTLLLLAGTLAVVWGVEARKRLPEADTRWEYKVVEIRKHPIEGVEKELNRLGARGWELAHVGRYEKSANLPGVFMLKRNGRVGDRARAFGVD